MDILDFRHFPVHEIEKKAPSLCHAQISESSDRVREADPPFGRRLLGAITPKYGNGHVASHRRGVTRARAKSNAILRAPVQHERVSLLHP